MASEEYVDLLKPSVPTGSCSICLGQELPNTITSMLTDLIKGEWLDRYLPCHAFPKD